MTKTTKELSKQNGQAVSSTQPINFKSVENYLSILHEEPKNDGKQIKRNAQAGGALYIPIGVMEMKLDQITGGLWSTENEKTQTIANELLCSIEVKFFHPVAKVWLTRVGVASVPIQQSKGSNLTDLNSKIKNALVKNYPAVKAQAFKNAVQSIGRAFGRDLNREDQIEYNRFSEKAEAVAEIEKANSLSELMEIWGTHPEWQDNGDVIDAFAKRKGELKKQVA